MHLSSVHRTLPDVEPQEDSKSTVLVPMHYIQKASTEAQERSNMMMHWILSDSSSENNSQKSWAPRCDADSAEAAHWQWHEPPTYPIASSHWLWVDLSEELTAKQVTISVTKGSYPNSEQYPRYPKPGFRWRRTTTNNFVQWYNLVNTGQWCAKV